MRRVSPGIFAVFAAAMLLCGSCRDHVDDNPAANRLPSTHLWLTPDSAVGQGVSRQHLYWYGEDPDGVVRGYLFAFSIVATNVTAPPSPDTLRYTWTSANDTTLLFPLDTLFRRFLVVVRGVDQEFPGLPKGSVVRLYPFPYRDVDDNGIFGGSDVQLPGLAGAMDPKGAALTFPIRNSPPSIAFVQSPADPTVPLRQPDTTFTAATFAWSASDPDGNNTLVSYRVSLNDTSGSAGWLTVKNLRDTMVTLVVPRARSDAAGATIAADVYAGSFLGRQYLGQLPGLTLDGDNVFYVEARDVAGEYSKPAVLPSGTDRWYVKRPRSSLLLVNDYVNSDSASALTTYLGSLRSVPGGGLASVDILNIGRGVTLADKNSGKVGGLVPPFVDPALIQTFLLYDYVLWYTDQQPSLSVAQLSLFSYIGNGGKVLFSTSFVNTIDPRGALKDFAPIDSVSSVNLSPVQIPSVGDNRIPADFVLVPDSSVPGNIYPQLAFNATPPNHSIFMRPLYPRSDARVIYRLQEDTRIPVRYLGTPTVGVVDGERKIIFVGLPLHLLNNTVAGNPEGLVAFFTRAFTREYNSMQVVNRAKF
jgi:hypothetical protein